MANVLTVEKRKMIFHLLCEGNGIRSINRLIGCSVNTIMHLQERYSLIVDFLNRKFIQELDMPEIEADEMLTFVKTKSNKKWVYVALDRESRLVVHFHIDNRDENGARNFISGLSSKLSEHCILSTDCLMSYVAAVKKNSYGRIYSDISNVFLLRAIEKRSNLNRAISNRIETHNGQSRMHVSKLSRRTKCYAKTVEALESHLRLYFFYYNFMKKHKSIKTVPAVAANIIKTPFEFEELLSFDDILLNNPSMDNPKKKDEAGYYAKKQPKSKWDIQKRMEEMGFIQTEKEVGKLKVIVA